MGVDSAFTCYEENLYPLKLNSSASPIVEKIPYSVHIWFLTKEIIYNWITCTKDKSVIHLAWQFVRWSSASGGVESVPCYSLGAHDDSVSLHKLHALRKMWMLQSRGQVVLYPFQDVCCRGMTACMPTLESVTQHLPATRRLMVNCTAANSEISCKHHHQRLLAKTWRYLLMLPIPIGNVCGLLFLVVCLRACTAHIFSSIATILYLKPTSSQIYRAKTVV